MGSLCAPSQQTTTTSNSPPPQVLANYQNLVSQAQQVASTPYQPYTGQIVPNLTNDQLNAMQLMDMSNQVAPQYYNAAQNDLSASNAPLDISNANTSQYVSPYAQAGAANAQTAGNNIAGYGTAAGQNIANYGNNAGNAIANYATGIGAAGPQLQQFSASNVNQYLNPYTQDVVNTTMANLNQNDAIQGSQLLGAGIQAGNAFGGDRLGVAEAELGRNQDMANNQTIAGLESAGYNTALGQFNTNNSQALAGQQTALQGVTAGANLGLGAQTSGAQLATGAQQAGAGLGLAGAQLGTSATQNAQQLSLAQQQTQNQNNLNTGNAESNLGTTALTSDLTSANAALQSGNQQQAQIGASDQAAYQQFLQQQAYPFQTTGWLGNEVLGVGSASGGTGTTTAPGPSVFGQAAGLGAAGLGAFMASDERVKDNVEQVGKSFDGQPIYRFNYKGSPTTQMGLIAQDVEHNHPGAVIERNGVKYVNYHAATEAAADKGHFAGGGAVGDGGIASLSANAPGMFQPIDFSSHGVRGYVPDSGGQVKMGSGPPKPPSAPSNAALPAGLSSGTATAIGKGLAGIPSYGGGNPLTDAYGGNASNPLPGLSAADYGEKDGGFISGLGGLRGFATDGAVTADDSDVINPGDPIRLDPAAMDRWHQSSDFISTHQDPTGPGDAPPTAMPVGATGVAPTPRPATLPPEISIGSSAPETNAPSQASAYAPQDSVVNAPPTPDQSTSYIPGWHQAEKPSPWLAVMQAGLAMAASRNPQILGAIGEGGLSGLGAYEKAQEKYNELDAHPIIDHSGPTTRIIYPSDGRVIDTHVPTMTAGQKVQSDETKRAHDLEVRRQAEAERHNKVVEEDKTPVGFRKTEDGLEAIPGGPQDPAVLKTTAEAKRVANAVLDDDTIHDMADQYLAGDRTVMQNLGRGAQGAENIVKLRQAIGKQAREAGVDPKGIVNAFNEQAGALAGQRAVGTRAANISLAANEANNMIPIALAASDKLPRTQYMSWNQMVQAVQKGSSSPELASFVAATNSLVNSYVRAVSPSGVPTDSMRDHAYSMLNAAQGPVAYKAVVETMKQEMQAALQAPGQVKADLRKGNEPAAAAAPATSSAAKPSLQEFLGKAKAANPNKSDKELTDYYNKTYGG